MSRAFISEGNGCGYCVEKQEECIYAENGECMLSTCRKYPKRADSKPEDKKDGVK